MVENTPDIRDPKHTSTDKYEIYLRQERLVYVHYFENSLIEKQDIIDAIEVGLKLSPSDDTKLLIEVDNHVDFTAEAREFAQDHMRTLKAEAHVFPSLANKILFNFFFLFRKSDHPLKAFSKVDSALSWLSEQ